jgi:hypothetical protein
MTTCGNENLHYLPPTEPEELAKKLEGTVIKCTLDAKHPPVRVIRTDSKGRDISTYEIVHSAPYPDGDKEHEGKFIFWSDAANVPIADRKFDKKKGAATSKPAPLKDGK